jgi:hypothetical protein
MTLRLVLPVRGEPVGQAQPVACNHCIKGQCYAERHREKGYPTLIRLVCLQCSRHYMKAYLPPYKLVEWGADEAAVANILRGRSRFVWVRDQEAFSQEMVLYTQQAEAA